MINIEDLIVGKLYEVEYMDLKSIVKITDVDYIIHGRARSTTIISEHTAYKPGDFYAIAQCDSIFVKIIREI